MNFRVISLYAMLFLVLTFGLSYALLTLHTIPDYDELRYVMDIHNIQQFIFSITQHSGILAFPGLTPTNTIHTIIMAILELMIPHSYAIFLLHFSYLLFMVFVLRRLFSDSFISIFLILLTANFYFLHLFGTYISEFSVGILLVNVMALTFFNTDAKNHKYLLISLALLILARTINLVFVAGFVGLFLFFELIIKKNKYRSLWRILRIYLYSVLITLPATFFTVKSQILYILVNSNNSGLGKNWQDMIGIKSRFDIPLYILNTITHYNNFIIPLLLISAVMYYLKFIKTREFRIESFYIIGTICMVVFAFTNANSSNHMVVFWVYILVAFLAAYVMHDILNLTQNHFMYKIVFIIGLFYVTSFLIFNYSKKYNYHQNRAEIYQISKILSTEINNYGNMILFSNYRGVGPLDGSGLSIQTDTKIGSVDFDALGYDKNISTYINAAKQANVLILANDNFLWQDYAKFINMNRHTSDIYKCISNNTDKLGIYPVRRINYQNDKNRYFEIFIRPTVNIQLPYEYINGDKWLTDKNAIDFIPSNIDYSTKQLLVTVEIPKLENYRPPFVVNLSTEGGNIIDSAECNSYGKCELIFDLPADCSQLLYLQTNKTFKSEPKKFEFSTKDWMLHPFSPKGTPDRVDWRKLSFKFIKVELIDKKYKILSGIYSDKWASREVVFKKYNNEDMVISGEIPDFAKKNLPITLSINKRDKIVINKTGQFLIYIKNIANNKIVVSADKQFSLPSPDTRSVSWKFNSFDLNNSKQKSYE